MSASENQIVVYKPNETVRLDVRHKVAYANEILVLALDSLVMRLAHLTSRRAMDVGRDLFSPERLITDKKVKIRGETISLPTDGDLIYLMKKYIPQDEFFMAYSERRHSHISLWKTHAEFMNIFSCRSKNLGQEDFWAFFNGKARKICHQYHAFCTFPSKIKNTHHELKSISVLSDSHSEGVKVKNNKLNLQYLFNPRIKDRPMYYMNAYLHVDYKVNMELLINGLKNEFAKCNKMYQPN